MLIFTDNMETNDKKKIVLDREGLQKEQLCGGAVPAEGHSESTGAGGGGWALRSPLP